MTGLRIALVKPDWGIRGGFELVIDRLVTHLESSGHVVQLLTFDAWRSDHRPFALRVPDTSWDRAPEYFTFMSQVESAQQLDVRRADLVISTQPPSYVVDHDRHLSLFFHHARMYYDLSPYVLKAGMVDPVAHEAAVAAVHRIDQPAFDRVRVFAAGSETVAARLRRFNAREHGVSLFHAGPSVDVTDGGADGSSSDAPIDALCVSRHDFPKRTELFVLASRIAADLRTVAVGTGSRIGMLRRLDERLLREGTDGVSSERLWLNSDPWIDPATVSVDETNLHFAGAVSDDALRAFYRRARCVVAPALLEDYGLTALEAMRYGKPVIVCSDGGHLAHLVRDGENGLVVEPTGEAIAAAVRHLVDDPELASRMGRCGREVAQEYTWARGMAEFDAAIAMTLS